MSDTQNTSSVTSILNDVEVLQSKNKQSGLNEVLNAPDAYKAETPRTLPDVRDGIVAFLDVLGTSRLMKSIDDADVTSEDIKKVYSTTIGMEDTFVTSLTPTLNKLGEDLKYMIISDSFVISVPSNQNALTELIHFIRKFQQSCLKSFSQPLRGAIAKGKIIGNISENKIIGSAFINAHMAEGKLAIYPRIILDFKLVEEFELDRLSHFREVVAKDADGIFYINFADGKFAQDIMGSIDAATEQENHFSPERQKWNWLRNYLMGKISGKKERAVLS